MTGLEYQNLSPNQIDWDATYRSQNPNWVQDLTPNQVDWQTTEERRHRSVRRPAREADFIDTGIIIGAEILGPVLGSAFGLGGIIVGSALGNYASQKYRIAKGFQSDIGLGELSASTALGVLPVGKFANVGMAGKTAIRAGQGAGLATAELTARTMIDEDRAPTRDEIATTLLFGGVFGGTLGAAEAKWMTNNLGTEVSEGMTRTDAVKAIGKDIKEANGVDNAKVGSPILEKIDTEGLSNIKDPEEIADKLLLATEVKLLDEVDTALGNLANRSPLEEGTKSFTTPTMERGALESFSKSSFSAPSGRQGILGGEPVMQDAVSQMANIQKALDDEIAQQNEIFKPILRQNEIGAQKQTELGIQRLGDTEEITRIKDRISILDHRLGKGKGSRQERARLNADLKRIYKRNGMNLLDLQDDMRRAQMSPTEPTVGMRDRPMKQADPMTKEERMAEKYFGKGYEKYFTGLLTTGAGASAAVSMFTEDEENEMQKAGFSPLLIGLLVLGGFSPQLFRKFKKTSTFKRANVDAKKNKTKAEPDFIKSERINASTERIYQNPSALSLIKNDIMEIAGRALSPISRQLKNIDKKLGTTLTMHFRNHDLRVSKMVQDYINRTMPFIKTMTKNLNEKQKEEFADYLLINDYDSIIKLIDEVKLMPKVGGQLKEMRVALEELREYGRREGGIDIGYLENYFPRLIKNPKALKKFLDEDPRFRNQLSEVDKAINDYATANKIQTKDIKEEELAEIISRHLRGFPRTESGVPPNFKNRKIFDENLLRVIKEAYEPPERALENYIRKTIETVETRKFLGKVRKPKANKVGFDSSQDMAPVSDLGIDVKLDDSLAGSIAKDFLKGTKFGDEDIEKLRDIIQSRFSGGSEKGWIRGLKNASYIQTMTSFGSAITQLADHAFSIHFNGLGNHFRTLANRKDMFNFAESIGLSNREFDGMTNTDKISKLLDKLFETTRLKQLDLFAKNAYMNTAWRKYHNMAKQPGGSQRLADELRSYFGERTEQIVKKIRENAPSNNKPPDEVTELVFHKLLDVAPATASEVPMSYMANPNARIFYMLKTFTLKQMDAFRTAGLTDMNNGMRIYVEGRNEGNAAKQEKGTRMAMKGLTNVIKIGSVFAAANATTDMIKDTIYGRPIKRDELFENNLWRLMGLNRYTYYTARREGIGTAIRDLIAPPVAIFDRASKDIDALVGDKEYKGAMLQGTPLDLIYWRHLGGLDKIQKNN